MIFNNLQRIGFELKFRSINGNSGGRVFSNSPRLRINGFIEYLLENNFLKGLKMKQKFDVYWTMITILNKSNIAKYVMYAIFLY